MHRAIIPILALALLPIAGATQPADDFVDHGVAVEVSQPRCPVVTTDEDGDLIAMMWLRDHSGCKSLLVVDAETGDSEQIGFERGHWDSPFTALLSSKNRWYAQFASCFYEFDPSTRTFIFIGETRTRRSMSMVEDASGVVWAAAHQKSPTTVDLVSFNPETRELVEHGQLQSGQAQWLRYPKTITYDDAGWIYIGIGKTLGQVTGYNPATGEIRRFIPQQQREHGDARVFRGTDGQVYATGPGWSWHILHDGEATPIETEKPPVEPDPTESGSQGTVRSFLSDASITDLDTARRRMTVQAPDGTEHQVTFDYSSNGRFIYSILRGPDDRLYGGAHGYAYCYDPATDTFVYHPRGGHLNCMAGQRGMVFGAKYTGGELYGYDISKPWDNWDREHPQPLGRGDARPHIVRPHVLLAHPDGRHLILGGTPHYGGTGGGLYIYDLETGGDELLGHEELLENLSTCSLVALPNGNLIGGSTISAGTGGQIKADQAQLYLFDFTAREIVWHEAIVPGARNIHDIILGPDGLVYGIAGGDVLFAFEPGTREVVHQEKLEGYGTSAGAGQGYRCMIIGPEGNIYAVFEKAIVQIQPGSFQCTKLAVPPDEATAGIALLEGRLYFCAGSHLWSYGLPNQ